MPKIIVTLYQECCRCKTKIQKVLTCLQDEFCIEKVEFEKSSKVTITGKFDADKLIGRLQYKAGKFIKNFEKVDDTKDENKDDEKDEKKDDEKDEEDDDEKDEKKEPPCKLVHVYPWSYPPCPNPYQVPCGAYPSWQGSCISCYPQQCQCYYYCKPPTPPPAARPSSPCACAKCRPSCSSGDHHGGGHGNCCGSSCSCKPVKTSAPAPKPAPEPAPKPAPKPAPVPVPVAVPYTYPAPFIVYDDNNPSYACSVM